MTASPSLPVPPLVRAVVDVRELLERARRTGDRREIEAAVERINAALVRAVVDVRELLERARRTGDRREIEAAVERINAALDERG